MAGQKGRKSSKLSSRFADGELEQRRNPHEQTRQTRPHPGPRHPWNSCSRWPQRFLCAPAAASTTSEIRFVSQTPADVVNAFVEAVNKGDRAAARALFAQNGFVAYGMQRAAKRGAELDGWLQSDIFGVKGRIENVTLKTEGNKVTLSGRYTSTGWSGTANYVFTIEGGRITAWNLL